MVTKAFQRVYTQIQAITKATIALHAQGVSNDELAMVGDRLAQVVKINGDLVTLQVFAGTEGIATDTEVVFYGEPPTLNVSDDLAGRFLTPMVIRWKVVRRPKEKNVKSEDHQ